MLVVVVIAALHYIHGIHRGEDASPAGRFPCRCEPIRITACLAGLIQLRLSERLDYNS
jgi:hypothetical protein